MGTVEVYTTDEKQLLLDDFRKSKLSAEKFADVRAAAGSPLKISSKTLRTWHRENRFTRKKSGPSSILEKPISDLIPRLIALAIFTTLNPGKRSRGAVYIAGRLDGRLTAKQVRYRLERLRDLIERLTSEAFEAVCLELKRARRKVHQRRLVYQIDATFLPARAFGEIAGTSHEVWVTITLDVASRLVVGFEVHFRYPTYADTIRALLRALLPSHGMSFIGWGIPWAIQSDNGSIFGPLFCGVLERLKVFAPKTDRSSPWQNGHIERTNRTFKDLMDFDLEAEILAQLPGSPTVDFSGVAGIYHPSDILRSVTAALTRYNLRKHRAIGTSPFQCWQREWPREVTRPFDEGAIFREFQISSAAKVTDGKVRLLDGTELDDSRLLPYRDAELTLTTAITLEADNITISCGDTTVLRTSIPRPSPVVDIDPAAMLSAHEHSSLAGKAVPLPITSQTPAPPNSQRPSSVPSKNPVHRPPDIKPPRKTNLP
jgi:transposase InsO family protein